MFTVAVLFLTVETLAELLQPALMAGIVDVGVAGRDITEILRYGAIMLAIAATGAVGAIIRSTLASKTSQLIGAELRSDLYQKVQSLSLENIDRLKPAAIITLLTNDISHIINFIQGIMRIMLKAPIICVGATVLLIIQTPHELPVVTVIIAISMLLILANMKLGYPRYGKLQSHIDKLNNVSREFLRSIRVVKAFSAEETEQQKFHEAAFELANAGTGATRIVAIFSPLINLVVNFGIVLLLWSTSTQNGGEIGRLIASVNYMTQILISLGFVSIILNSAVRAVASSNRVQEVFDEIPAQATKSVAGRPTFGNSLEFEDVSFTYCGTARPAVEHLSLHVEGGETVGIIGSTGSGKSTLVNLIPRLYDATRGRILVGGINVKDYDIVSLRKHVAIAPQEPLLFSGTISHNLLFGNTNASEDEIYSASAIAYAHDFISDLADSYDTELGQGGVNLSGGQKQRLCLARALIAKPAILILDDCTSALDAITESKLLDSLRTHIAGMTVLLISQRVSTVMRCDRILFMKDGRIVGNGTHRALVKDCEHYRAIYEAQIGRDVSV